MQQLSTPHKEALDAAERLSRERKAIHREPLSTEARVWLDDWKKEHSPR